MWRKRGEHSVATTNANDSRPRDNRGREARPNESYKPRNSRENGSNNVATGQGNREYKPFNRENKPYNKDNRENKPFNRENKPFNKDAKPFVAGRDNKDGKTTGGFNKSRDYKGGGYNKDKDYDGDNKYGKSYGNGKDQRMGDSRTKTGQNKEKEQQPDKLETIKRLEKEKKVMQKKSEEINRQVEKPIKPPVKQRRTNNIDWTKGYANGLYGDDDEDYTEFI